MKWSWSFVMFEHCWSRDSSVGVVTRYGLEGPGIESRWGEIFRTYPDRLRGPPTLLYNGYWVFPGGKGVRGVMLTSHPLPVPRLRKSWVIPPLTLWVLLGLLRGSPFYEHCCLLFINIRRAVLVGRHEWGLGIEVLVNTATPCQIWILSACFIIHVNVVYVYTGQITYTNFVPMQSCLCGVFKLQCLTGYGTALTNSKLAMSWV
jgi:hypothetical protein